MWVPNEKTTTVMKNFTPILPRKIFTNTEPNQAKFEPKWLFWSFVLIIRVWNSFMQKWIWKMNKSRQTTISLQCDILSYFILPPWRCSKHCSLDKYVLLGLRQEALVMRSQKEFRLSIFQENLRTRIMTILTLYSIRCHCFTSSFRSRHFAS